MSKCIMARNALASPIIRFLSSAPSRKAVESLASASDINLLQLAITLYPFDQTDSSTALISVSPYSYSIALPYALDLVISLSAYV